MGKKSFAGPVAGVPPVEVYGLADVPEEPERPRCKKCRTPLTCDESIRSGLCRVCRPHTGKQTKWGKR